jgi:hypothetical protein
MQFQFTWQLRLRKGVAAERPASPRRLAGFGPANL